MAQYFTVIMYVYILKCGENLLYTGVAANPERRLRQHIGLIKGGAKFTRIHKVQSVMAIWDAGEYARKLEYFIKNNLTHSQKQFLVENPGMSFSGLGFEIPADVLKYISPDELNEKYNLK